LLFIGKKEVEMKRAKNSYTVMMAVMMLVPVFSFAKSQVKASKIIDQINDGKPVQYENIEIIGDLDFTSIKDITLDKPYLRSRNTTKTYSCHIKSPLSFINCVFRGDVIGYVHDDWKNETHNAVFHEDVDFQVCNFQALSAFKYAKFFGKSNFENTQFHKEAFFKYAKFSTKASFSNAYFYNDANFKYANFPKAVNFDKATFRRLANFKYIEFPLGVNFENAEFNGEDCFKYTKFHEPINFNGAAFNDDVDFKYTKLDGRSFTLYLLNKKTRR